MRAWCIYYGDGATLRSQDAQLEMVPGENVIGIVQADADPGDVYATGRELLFDRDFYWWDDGRWVKGDLCGLFDYLRRPGWRKVLAGRSIARDRYKAILLAMQANPEFPVKSALGPGEERLRE